MTPTEVMDKLRLQSSGWPVEQIKVVKRSQSATLLNRRDAILKRIGDAQSEIGRLNRLLDELRADVLHLMIE